MLRILFVEDEENIREPIKLNLEMENYEVVIAENGKDAISLFAGQRFDLVILDVMLPGSDGFQICEQMRLNNMEVPIMFLTAKDSSLDKINGLRKGADDYLTKPISIEELLLRVQKLIRRSRKDQSKQTLDSYQFGGNKISFITYEAEGVNGKFQLTKKEAMLLKLLIDRKNEVVSRQQILQAVWGYDVYPSTRTIDNFILSFRKYFEKDGKEPTHFHSIRGVGYRFTD